MENEELIRSKGNEIRSSFLTKLSQNNLSNTKKKEGIAEEFPESYWKQLAEPFFRTFRKKPNDYLFLLENKYYEIKPNHSLCYSFYSGSSIERTKLPSAEGRRLQNR